MATTGESFNGARSDEAPAPTAMTTVCADLKEATALTGKKLTLINGLLMECDRDRNGWLASEAEASTAHADEIGRTKNEIAEKVVEKVPCTHDLKALVPPENERIEEMISMQKNLEEIA